MNAHPAHHLELLHLREVMVMTLDHHMLLHHESQENKNANVAIQLIPVLYQQALEIQTFVLRRLDLVVGATLLLLATMRLLCRRLLDLLLMSHLFQRIAVPHP